MRTTRRFRTGGVAPARTRQFRLPEAQRAAPAYVPKYEALTAPGYRDALVNPKPAPPPAPAPAPARPVRRRAQAQAGLFTVRAPVSARKDRRQVGALLASDEWMPGPLGGLRLRIDRDAVDLSRVAHGNLPAALDHNSAKPFGRVTEASVGGGQFAIVVEVSNGALGDEAFHSITERTRGGWSPGYYVKQARMMTKDDADYDESDPFRMEVVKHMPVEATLTSVPMNSRTRTLSISHGEKASMENAVVHDMVSMSYDVAKAVLRGDTGSEDQRKRLRAYVVEYDKQVAAGTDRYEAAMAARAIALA